MFDSEYKEMLIGKRFARSPQNSSSRGTRHVSSWALAAFHLDSASEMTLTHMMVAATLAKDATLTADDVPTTKLSLIRTRFLLKRLPPSA